MDTLKRIEADRDKLWVRFECILAPSPRQYQNLVNDLDKLLEELLEYKQEEEN